MNTDSPPNPTTSAPEPEVGELHLDKLKEGLESAAERRKRRLTRSAHNLASGLRGDAEAESYTSPLVSIASASAAQAIEETAAKLDQKDIPELLSDVSTFARRQPRWFLSGSLAFGLIAGRFLRTSREGTS